MIGLLGWTSLALAQLERHSLPAVFGLTALALAVIVVLVIWLGGMPRIRVDGKELLLLAALAALAVFMFFPGFSYAYGDKDPGVYVEHGFAVAREGSIGVDSPVLAQDEVPVQNLYGGPFPGLWIDQDDSGRILPQFFHLYPALLGTAAEIGGAGALFAVGPFVGVLSVLGLAVAARRAFNGWVAALAGVLLTTNMLQVWQVKYPSTEVLTQLLVVTALLGLVVTIRSGWRPAAGVAGLATGLVFLTRPDGILLVLLALGIGAILLALRRWDVRCGWFAAGLAVTLPHALLQAYDLNEVYARVNDVPSFPKIVALAGVLLVGAVLLRRFVAPVVLDRWDRRTPEDRRRLTHRLGIAITVIGALLVLLGFLRPFLFGDAFGHTADGRAIRSFDERNLLRLSWFFTIPGIVLVWAGLAVVALKRWQPAKWALILPGLVLMPLYVFEARISSRMMWWGRRFIPVVILVMVVLIAVALVEGLRRQGRGAWVLRIGAGLLTVFLLGWFLRQSVRLRDHDEYGGSLQVVEAVARVAGDDDALFLWTHPETPQDGTRNLGGPVTFIEDQQSTLLPEDPRPGLVRRWQDAFPDREVFLVTDEPLPPSSLSELPLELESQITAHLPYWEETDDAWPPRALDRPIDLWVWQVG